MSLAILVAFGIGAVASALYFGHTQGRRLTSRDFCQTRFCAACASSSG